ncbi:hypothetical protein [Nocardioides cavernaquae]|uniref:hypothetical protein n=1 Tax=Nocardioides cavernaquae TaxID=2321396 RepID=UPI0015FFC821|nr:hypothetical protein [Nocardioides cavernaquae]
MAGFENPLWTQLQKIKVTREGGIEAPVKANGTDGIVIGDPPLFVTPPAPDGAQRKPGLFARLLQRITRG